MTHGAVKGTKIVLPDLKAPGYSYVDKIVIFAKPLLSGEAAAESNSV